MTDESRGPLPAKLYFRIGEVAGLVGVEPHVLRYWEREFRSIRPSKSAKGQRVYSRRDVENLLRVRELLYGQGFTIAGAKKRLRDKGVDAQDAMGTEASGLLDTAGDTTGTSDRPAALSQPAPLEHHATNAMTSVYREESRTGGDGERIRLQLEDLKSEIEAFLEELGA